MIPALLLFCQVGVTCDLPHAIGETTLLVRPGTCELDAQQARASGFVGKDYAADQYTMTVMCGGGFK